MSRVSILTIILLVIGIAMFWDSIYGFVYIAITSVDQAKAVAESGAGDVDEPYLGKVADNMEQLYNWSTQVFKNPYVFAVLVAVSIIEIGLAMWMREWRR